jgi:IS5 family transposase
MVVLLYLRHAFDLRDKKFVDRWGEHMARQLFSGMEHCTPELPCGAMQFGRFRRGLGVTSVGQLLKSSIAVVANRRR